MIQTALNFLRQDTPESATRLVGVGCFLVGCGLSVYAVVAAVSFGKPVVGAVVGIIGLVFVQGGVALGLRKVGGETAVEPEEPKP